jgi:hypothetical protein
MAVIFSCFLLRRAAGPPDQPESAEDRDLQHDEQEEDWQKPLHAASLEDLPAWSRERVKPDTRNRERAKPRIRKLEMPRFAGQNFRAQAPIRPMVGK